MSALVETVSLVRPFWLPMNYAPADGQQYLDFDTQIGQINLSTTRTSLRRQSPTATELNDPAQASHLHLVHSTDIATRAPTEIARQEQEQTRDIGLRTNFLLPARLVAIASQNRPKQKMVGRTGLKRTAGLTARPKRHRQTNPVAKKRTVKKYVRLARMA